MYQFEGLQYRAHGAAQTNCYDHNIEWAVVFVPLPNIDVVAVLPSGRSAACSKLGRSDHPGRAAQAQHESARGEMSANTEDRVPRPLRHLWGSAPPTYRSRVRHPLSRGVSSPGEGQ